MKWRTLITSTVLVPLLLVACSAPDSGAREGAATSTDDGEERIDPRDLMSSSDLDEVEAQVGDETEENLTPAPSGPAAGLPAGYELRFDAGGTDLSGTRVTTIDGGIEIRSGPPAILYRPTQSSRSWNYMVSARFTAVDPGATQDQGFGIFFGGSDLQVPTQAYTSFLIRSDGRYMVSKRTGSETTEVTDGWVAIGAAAGSEGEGITLAVRIEGDDVHFSIDGTGVAVFPAADLHTHGIAGVHYGRNLHLRVTDWTLGRG